MRAFQFPLDRVLVFRKRQWEAEAAALESLLANRVRLNAHRQQVADSVENAAARIANSLQVDASTLAEFQLARSSSQAAIRQIDGVLAQLRDKIVAQQRACMNAKRNCELLIRLREKRYGEWLLEANREEESIATETYLAKFSQRRLAVSSRNSAPEQMRGAILPPSSDSSGGSTND